MHVRRSLAMAGAIVATAPLLAVLSPASPAGAHGTLSDPPSRVWVGNFGFQSPVCGAGPKAASNDSASLFRSDGVPLSPRCGGVLKSDSLVQLTLRRGACGAHAA